MKRQSLTDPLPDRLPMTPPDNNEPDLAGPADCICGCEPQFDYDTDGRVCFLCRCGTKSPLGDCLSETIENWNAYIGDLKHDAATDK